MPMRACADAGARRQGHKKKACGESRIYAFATHFGCTIPPNVGFVKGQGENFFRNNRRPDGANSRIIRRAARP